MAMIALFLHGAGAAAGWPQNAIKGTLHCTINTVFTFITSRKVAISDSRGGQAERMRAGAQNHFDEQHDLFSALLMQPAMAV